jgi:hypothetical protein
MAAHATGETAHAVVTHRVSVTAKNYSCVSFLGFGLRPGRLDEMEAGPFIGRRTLDVEPSRQPRPSARQSREY